MSKKPRVVLDDQANTIFAFPPNRDTLGSTAYLIVENQMVENQTVGNQTNLLIDCPAWEEVNQAFLQEQGGIQWLLITHRGGLAKAREIQQAFNCRIAIQEQEAYLLPGLEVTSFHQTFRFTPHSEAIWTPGHTPGSSCLYHSTNGGILFTGRHLLPNQSGNPVPLKTAKTFHWPRQLRSVQALRDRFTPETLNLICPGANTGFLRGERAIADAYQRLSQLDLTACLEQKVLL
ncbi:MAG: MBL fold metallo-hydrolase [Leptolyngbyaceae bacterium]|nr:MBL fold metallo-hydrolase [Leptolyngbyaceae bacterium]